MRPAREQGAFMANEKKELAHYCCRRIAGPLAVDGILDKNAWQTAERSPRFVDMVNGDAAWLDTRMAALYDDEKLYLAYWLEEPCIRASRTERDSLVWLDNDVELFIDGEDCYYELEINAYNTVYEVFFIYQDALKAGSRFWGTGDFDLYRHNVDVLCGFQDAARYKKSKRGKRWAFMDWDFPGLETAVRLDGVVNRPAGIDKGWTVEIALPWAGFQSLYGSRSFPPKAGETLRAAFFRFEQVMVNGQAAGSQGWALNPHGAYDSHIPEAFSWLHFE
jgi:hypothetical protein